MAGARRNTHPSHLRSTAWELIRFEPVRDVRPKYARKQPKSASAFNCPRYSTCCYAQLPASFTNFLHYCSPSPGFYDAGKEQRQTRRQSIWMPPHPDYRCPTSIIPHFYAKCPYCCNPRNLSWLSTCTE